MLQATTELGEAREALNAVKARMDKKREMLYKVCSDTFWGWPSAEQFDASKAGCRCQPALSYPYFALTATHF